MPTRTLAFTLTLLMIAPFAAAAGGPDAEGVVPVGTGGAQLSGVDHHRHVAPDDAVGIVIPREVTTQAYPCADCSPRFALMTTCPDGMACTAEARAACLIVHAPAGSVAVHYAFEWTDDPEAATLRFADLPRLPPSGTTVCG